MNLMQSTQAPLAPTLVDESGNPLRSHIGVTTEGKVTGYGQRRNNGKKKDMFLSPPNRHPDADWDDMTRDQIVAKTKQVVRNNEMAFGSIEQHVDAVVGKRFRLKPTPPQKMLGWDRAEYREFVKSVRELWKLDSTSNSRWMDAAGKKTFTQLVAQHTRAFRIFGESFAVIYNRTLPEIRPFGMAAGLIDPARVRTPEKFQKDEKVTAGIRHSDFGFPQEYFVFDRHPGGTAKDRFGFIQGMNQKEKYRVLRRYSKLGRVQCLHSYLEDMPGLSRGVPVFAPALSRLECLQDFQVSTLNAAAWQATVAATLESEFADTGDVYVLDEDSGRSKAVNSVDYHMGQRNEWNNLNKFQVADLDMAQLWNGDKLKLNSPGQPIAKYAEFERSMLKHFARALGTSYEWMAQDWSDTNYSGARAGLITTWRRIDVERANVAEEIANAMYSAWMEDNIANGRIKVPGIKDPSEAWVFYLANRDALTCANWYGPVKEEIDRAKTIAFYAQLKKMGCATDDLIANELLDTDSEDITVQQTEEAIFKLEQAYEMQKASEELKEKYKFDLSPEFNPYNQSNDESNTEGAAA